MSVNFEIKNNICLLIYSISGGDIREYYSNCISKWGIFRLKNTFFFRKDDRISNDEDENSITFSFGEVSNDYIKINGSVLDVNRDYYFHVDIDLKVKFFVGYYSTSIIKKLDSIFPKSIESVYIDLDVIDNSSFKEGVVHIGFSLFKKFLDSIPKKTEVDNYIRTRFSAVFYDLFPFEIDRIKEKHNNLLSSKRNNILNFLDKTGDFQDQKIDLLYEFELLKIKSIKEYLSFLVENPSSVPELVFQKYIAKIICLVFPKYIHAVREITLTGIDSNDKRPDFLLIDHQGFIDVLEIKTPSFCLLKDKKYRNNYVISNELASTVQQTEKYILCLNHYSDSFEKKPPERIVNLFSQNRLTSIHINNPIGLIIAGRDNEHTEQQVNDLELVRRQFRNIVDIITYDDLLRRLDNSISQLSSPENIVVDN